MRTIAASLVLLGLAAHPGTAHATWADTGLVIINQLPSAGALSVYLKRAPGGDVVALVAGRSQTAMGYSAQRVSPTGTIAAGWAPDGVFLNTADVSENFHTHALVSDDLGGVFHAGVFDRTTQDSTGFQYAQPGGALKPYAFGDFNHWRIARASYFTTLVDAAPDGAGGAYVAWTFSGVRLQRRHADGTIEPGWSSFGRFIAASGSYPGLDVEPDGSGGAVVFWTNEGDRPRAIRILSDTTAAPGWSAGGLALGANAPAQGYASADLPRLVPSGPDHWIAVWREPPFATPIRVVAQRFGLDGTLDPAWPAAGLVVVAPQDGITFTNAMSDGLDGLHVLWDLNGAPRWTHVLASGAFASGHSSAGISPLEAGSQFSGPATSYEVAAPALNGGLIYLWNDTRGPSIRVRWLLADGTADPSEAVRVIAVPSTNGVKAAISDGAGGVYVVWQKTYDSFTRKLYMTQLARTAPVAVPREPARPAGGLALRVPSPNPARAGFDVRFTLPDDAPARLELFDLSGRLLRAMEVKGEGSGTARFERPGELRAGLYVVRLSRGRDTRTARIVIAP